MSKVSSDDDCVKNSGENRQSNRRTFLKTAAIGTSVALAGCSGGSNEDGSNSADGSESGGNSGTTDGSSSGSDDEELADELTVLTWGGSYGEAQKEVFIDSFADEYGVDVTWGQFGSDWDLLTEQRTGGTEVDVAQPGQTAAYLGANEELLLPLRTENMDNWDNLRDRFRNPEYDPGEDFHVAGLCYGGNGIVYNTDYMDEPSSWDDIYTEDTRGQVALPRSIDSVVAIAASDLEMDLTSLDENYDEKMDQVWERVGEINEYIFEWWDSGSTMQQLLTEESAITGQLWTGRVYDLRTNEDVPVEYTVPEEGTSYWCDSYGVASNTDRRYTAEQFIDHVLQPELMAEFTSQIPYGPCVPVEETPEALEGNSDIENIDKLTLLHPELAEENRQEWEREFQSIIGS
jgi:spermidine/putrescine-binding protein